MKKLFLLFVAALVLTSCEKDSGEINNNYTPQYEKQILYLPGMSNARQLGGYVIGDKTVRNDVLLRSGALSEASDEAILSLRDKYRLALVVDFRSSMERGAEPDRDVEGAQNVWLPVLEKMVSGEETGSPLTLIYMYKNDPARAIELLQQPEIREAVSIGYDLIVFDEACQRSYAAFLDSLVALPDGRAVLWHCTHGKDRTGWGTAFLLAALGAERSLIIDDFAMSNIPYAQDIESLASVARAQGLEDELIEYIRILRGVSVAFFEKTLDSIDARYGSIDNYLEQALELTSDERQILKDKFLCKP